MKLTKNELKGLIKECVTEELGKKKMNEDFEPASEEDVKAEVEKFISMCNDLIQESIDLHNIYMGCYKEIDSLHKRLEEEGLLDLWWALADIDF